MFSKFFKWLGGEQSTSHQKVTKASGRLDAGVKNDALRQLRETRADLMRDHADALERVKRNYERSQNPSPNKQGGADEAIVQIDRNKNMESILRFMQISKSPAMRQKLRDVMKNKLQ